MKISRLIEHIDCQQEAPQSIRQVPKGFATNIEEETIQNNDYRRVVYTTYNSQLVYMSIEPGQEIGMETHYQSDQFFRFEQGRGVVIIGEMEREVKDGDAVVVPAGNRHNVINTGREPLKLYAIYSPPVHKRGIIVNRKEDETEEHFDGEVDF